MAQKDERATSQTESLDNDDVLRKRLLKRVALATAVVVVLLGGLMFFDSMMVHTEKASKQIARIEPPTKPIEKQGDEGKPADEAAAKPAEIAAEPAEPAKEPIAEPERTEAPTTVSRPERPLTMPATARQAMVRSAEPAPAVQKPEPTKEIARVMPPVAHLAQPTLASRPIARAVESTRQFLLQVGVFNNIANAEELRARLEGAGVPARIEARVQAGPFASRQEIEQARERLKSLGIDPGLIVAARK
jgi:cell division protein FtsN